MFARNMSPPSSGSRVNQAKNQRETGKSANFLLGLFFDPENGGDIVLQSVG
jgi:hypothetical protein